MVIFEIIGIRQSDEGQYTCIAKNRSGNDKVSFNIGYSEQNSQVSPKFTTQIKVKR